MFQAFLRTEFSEENLEFWLACEDFKKVKSQSKMAAKAKKIFAEYIAIQACKEVRPQWPRGAQEGERREGRSGTVVRPGWRGASLGPWEGHVSIGNKSERRLAGALCQARAEPFMCELFYLILMTTCKMGSILSSL